MEWNWRCLEYLTIAAMHMRVRWNGWRLPYLLIGGCTKKRGSGGVDKNV